MTETMVKVPPLVLEKYDELYELVQNESNCGLLLPKQVARYLNKDVQWLQATIYEGGCPFAFGTNRGVSRGNSCIHVLPFYSFMTQNALFQENWKEGVK